MFEALSIHMAVDPTVFLELLIGLSPIGITPPEINYQARILQISDAAGSSNADRTPTTEDIYGFGCEALGVNHA